MTAQSTDSTPDPPQFSTLLGGSRYADLSFDQLAVLSSFDMDVDDLISASTAHGSSRALGTDAAES